MKALTIEELKALQVGDWVWITTIGSIGGFYAQIDEDSDCNMLCVRGESMPFVYRKYGKMWLAYKNKEFAESNGEWVELPCLRDKEPISLVKETLVKRKELNYMTKDGTICSEIYWESDFEQAENRLREFQKECK